MDAALRAAIGLSAVLDDVGPRALQRLLATAGSDLERAWGADRALLAAAGFTADAAERFLSERASCELDALVDATVREGIRVIVRNDPAYPPLLAAIPDPPIAIFVRGDPTALAGRAIAVVGTRSATPYGLAACAHLVAPLARNGLTIVSGLAYGVDAAAHRACLDAGGTTVAILGTGVDAATVYPPGNRALAARIAEAPHCLASEYPPHTPGRPLHFPARNRIVAGLTVATLVVEAPADSGALITARFALDFGREVFAVPGPITSPAHAGANALLRQGAIPATSATDIADALHLNELLPPTAPKHPTYTGTAGTVFAAIAAHPIHVDDLRATIRVATHELASALTSLEIDGAIRDVGGGRYIRTH